MDINFNFNFNSGVGIQPDMFQGLNQASLGGVNSLLTDIFGDGSNLLNPASNQFSNNQSIMAGGCCTPPSQSDSAHPEGSLKTDGGVITTPGGYKIESTGKFEWQITGPDGKTTKVWGDPHVEEGDGGKWDFKRNSTFMLGDGTKVNVSTTDYGNGATVTQGLEILSGNDRVTVSGIDKGKGVVGQVTHDAKAHANDFGGNDVFVMGQESDDWSFQGKEIIGSEKQGESFKLGNDLAAGDGRVPTKVKPEDLMRKLNDFMMSMLTNWMEHQNNWKPNQIGSNPYNNDSTNNHNDVRPNNGNNFNANNSYNRAGQQNSLRNAFKLISVMFNLMSRLEGLSDQMHTMRNRSMFA